MSKKILGSKAGASKLFMAVSASANSFENEKKEERKDLNLINRKKRVFHPKSYRLNQADIERIRSIMQSINQYGAHKTFSETDLIKGLLVVGEKLTPEKIILAIKDSF